jgi:hypothetical protein
MNHFLILKNELSMAFLRHLPNLANTCKLALEIFAGETPNKKIEHSQIENSINSLILNASCAEPQ